jgi:O-antigen ligase/cytochrome c-type biogenesis protein CcmH/NrfG
MKPMERKIFVFLLASLLACVTAAFSTRFEYAFVTPKRFLLHFFTAALFIFWAYSLFACKRSLPGWKLLIPVPAYLAIVALSCAASANPAQGVDHLIDLLCCVAIFLVTVSTADREDARKILALTHVTGIGVGIYSLAQHWGLDPVPWQQGALVASRSISTLGNPDFLSAYLVMLMPLALCQGLSEENRVRSTAFLLLWGFYALVNLFTYSRTGLVSMAAGVIVPLCLIGFSGLRRHKSRLTGAALLMVAALGLLILYEKLGASEHSFSQRVEAFVNPRENNVATRLGLWKAGIIIFLQNPLLGVGPGNFDEAYLPLRYLEPVIVRFRTALPGSPHNIFIEIAAASGIFALLSFLAFTGIFTWRGAACFKKEGGLPGERDRLALAGMGGCIAAFYVHHLAGFSTAPTDVLFWVTAGLCWPCMGPGVSIEAREKALGPAFLKPATLIVLVLLGYLAMERDYRTASADYFLHRGEAYRAAMREEKEPSRREALFSASLHMMNRSVELDPGRFEYWVKRGKLLEEYSFINTDRSLSKLLVTRADSSYRNAIRLKPRNPYPYADLGRLLSGWGLLEPSEEFYRKAVELDPYNPVLATDLAALLDARQKYGEAEKYFKAALEIYPIGYWTYGNLGTFYFHRKEYRRAGEMLTKAVSLEAPENDPRMNRYKALLDKLKGMQKEKEPFQ